MKERRKTTGKKLGNKRNTSAALFGMCCCHLNLNILLGYFVWKKTIFSPPQLSSLAAWPDCKRRDAFTALLMSLACQMLESRLNCSPVRVIPFLTSAVPPSSFPSKILWNSPPPQLHSLQPSNCHHSCCLLFWLDISLYSVWAQHLQTILSFGCLSLTQSALMRFIIDTKIIRESCHFLFSVLQCVFGSSCLCNKVSFVLFPFLSNISRPLPMCVYKIIRLSKWATQAPVSSVGNNHI